MATEKKVWSIIEQAGFEPLKNKGIIVKYAPQNLSEKIAKFFNMDFYVLQLCKDEILLIPFNQMASLKKEIVLQIPYSTISAVEISDDILNYVITIKTDTDTIRLTAQQKELSDFRSSGTLSIENMGLNMKNWHKDNLDSTLDTLKGLK